MCDWRQLGAIKALVYGIAGSGAPSSEGLAVCPIVCREQKWKKKKQLGFIEITLKLWSLDKMEKIETVELKHFKWVMGDNYGKYCFQ